jgi:hypothetical protein
MAVPKSRTRGGSSREDRNKRKPPVRRSREDSEDNEDLFDTDQALDRTGVASQLIARYGTANAALEQVMGERFRESQKRRRLQAQLADLEEELEGVYDALGLDPNVEIPGKSAVVSEADKAELEEFRKFGKLDEVKKKMGDFEVLSQKVADAESLELRTKSAKLAGGWDVDVLSTMVRDLDLVLELKEVDKEGGIKEEVPFVRENKDKAESSRLTDFVQKHERAKKLLPALTANTTSNDLSRRGTSYPRTTGGGTQGKNDTLAPVTARDVRPSQAKAGAPKNT